MKAHKNNIPSIAFCNTAEDPGGRYLASIDIAGVTIIWDVERGIPVRMMKAHIPLQIEYAHQYDTDASGWGMLFLDRRSFKPTQSIVEAMGVCSSIGGTVTSW